jgi:hypothetical protein
MADLEDLARAVRAYERDEWSLDQFADWFRNVSRRKFAEPVEVRKAIFEIDAIFSEMHYAHKSQAEFRKELANAVRPFAGETGTAERVVRLEFEIASHEPKTSSATKPLVMRAAAA